MKSWWAMIALFLLMTGAASAAELDPAALYQRSCASCHGGDRLGGTGPALMPENLERLRKSEATKTLSEGRPATQMAGFAASLSREQIDALVGYIYSPASGSVRWGAPEIRASHQIVVDTSKLGAKPRFQADPLNLFIVVETGDHHATLLDGDTFTPIHRFKTRWALHGGPKFSPDGRFVYTASRDGWISKFDLYNLQLVAEIRAGINTRNLAVSDDGRFVLVGNYLPGNLVLLDARDLRLLKVIPAKDASGHPSRVSAVYQAAPRKSFVVALKDVPEIWELSYDDAKAQSGWVHDHGPNSDELRSWPIRRIALDQILDDFSFDPSYRYVVGAARDAAAGQVVDLDAGAKIASVELPGLPHLGSAITWQYRGHPVMATPNLKENLITILDMTTWKTIKQIATPGPGFFLRSHENTPYAWADVFSGPDKDAMLVIDKRTLEIVKVLRPSPGKTSAHTEFTRDGRYALVSLWEMDGAIVVYDAATFQEVKRIPMVKPSGKYNVFNKTTRSAGTSH